MSRRPGFLYLFFLVAVAVTTATADAQTIKPETLDCLPSEANSTFAVDLSSEIKGSEQARLYFRRLNRTGAFYWIQMTPSGNGNYWTTFPRPERREQQQLTDEWWEILENRDWMEDNDREWLEDWLEEQEHEAAEYYVAITDVSGKEKTRTDTMLVAVRDREDCRAGMNAFEVGKSRNLVVGETTGLQQGKEVYHWRCEGIVSRVNADGVLRADEICRACVVAGWLPIASTTGAIVAGTTIDKREPRRASGVLPRFGAGGGTGSNADSDTD